MYPPMVEQPWYFSATFWSIAAAVVAVAAIVVGGQITHRSAHPRTRLDVVCRDAAPPVLPLLESEWDIEASHQGRVLTQPRAVTITVTVRGPRDIARNAFGGTPLTVDLDTPVVTLIEQHSHPGRTGISPPPITITTTGLKIGPALLSRSHELSYTVILDGAPNLIAHGDLADVHIRARNLTQPSQPR